VRSENFEVFLNLEGLYRTKIQELKGYNQPKDKAFSEYREAKKGDVNFSSMGATDIIDQGFNPEVRKNNTSRSSTGKEDLCS
jgi:hypothetical protein